MSLQPIAQSLVGPLDAALVKSEEKLLKGDQEISDLSITLAFNLGRKFEALKREEGTLKREMVVQKRRIEVLEAVHQEKWTACLETADEKMRSLSPKISKIIQSIETFRATHQRNRQLANGNIPKDAGTFWCQDIYMSKYFEPWLKMADEIFFIDDESRKHPKYPSQIKIVELVQDRQTISVAAAFPQMAPIAQDMQALEKQVACRKQELRSLKESPELKETDHQNAIKKLKWVFRAHIFQPNLKTAKKIHACLEGHINHNVNVMPTMSNSHQLFHSEIIKECERLKDMVSEIIPQIQEADDWSKGETA